MAIALVATAGCAGRWQNHERYGACDGQQWAAPVACPGAPNLYKVTDGVYRGAEPGAVGFRCLERMGVRTVVNLQTMDSDRDELEGTDLDYEHIWFRTWHPEDEDVVRFLNIATDPARTPVFVHCRRGADRTGLMCAVYRVVVCGWSKEEAIREMTQGGFGFDHRWRNLVEYVEALDVPKMEEALVHAE